MTYGSDTVYVLNAFHSAVRYHRYGRIRGGCDVTACGCILWEGRVKYHAVLRADQAALFAKPCRSCYPNGAV